MFATERNYINYNFNIQILLLCLPHVKVCSKRIPNPQIKSNHWLNHFFNVIRIIGLVQVLKFSVYILKKLISKSLLSNYIK